MRRRRVPGGAGAGASLPGAHLGDGRRERGGATGGLPGAMPGIGAAGFGHEKTPKPFGGGRASGGGGSDSVRQHRKPHGQPKEGQKGEA